MSFEEVNEIITERLADPIGPDISRQIAAIFPLDELKEKRVRNLAKAGYVLVARAGGEICGTLFIRNIIFLPNATWIVAASHQRRGIALKLIKQAQADFFMLTAVSRNKASKKLAQKAGFLVLPFGVGVWFRRFF